MILLIKGDEERENITTAKQEQNHEDPQTGKETLKYIDT